MKTTKIISSLLLTCLLLSSCGGKKDDHTHSYDDWETVTKATCTTEGKKERFCDCGEKQTRKIALLDHTFNESGVCTICSATNSAQAPGANSQNNGQNNTNNNQNNNSSNSNLGNDAIGEDDNIDTGGWTPAYGSSVGDLCPDYTLGTIDGQGKVNIKAYTGRIVVINFWGTWCGPCKSELPDFNAIATDYDGEVVVIAVHSVFNATSKAEAPNYIQTNYSDSKILFAYDKPLDSYTDYYFNLLGGTNTYPRTLIVDENGIIAFTHDGILTYNQLSYEIDKILPEHDVLDD